MHKIIAVSLISLLLASPFTYSENSEDGETAYNKGMNLLENGEPKNAIEYLKKAYDLSPESYAANWGLGDAYLKNNNPAIAKKYFEYYKNNVKDDPEVYEKLIQIYESIGKFGERDDNIMTLRSMWSGNINEEYSNNDGYVRDLFIEEKRIFAAYEHFNPESPNQIFYRFLPLKEKNRNQFISLGSYDSTSNITRELENKPKDWRLYHLDGYCGDVHTTYGFFDEKPNYDEIKDIVLKIFSDDQLPCK